MRSTDKPLISCDKCDSMQQIFESKMFTVIRDLSKYTKILNEEQTTINSNMNNTINTVNLLIDQLEENKVALREAQNEIKNLKNEIDQLKNEKEIKEKSILVSSNEKSSNSLNNNNSNENLSSIIDEIRSIKRNICCLKYEVKKIKTNKVDDSVPINQFQSIENLSNKMNDLKRDVEDIKIKNSKKRKFKLGKKKEKKIPLSEDNGVESKYFESSSADETERETDSIIIDRFNMQQASIDKLNEEVNNIKENVFKKTIKDIKKQISKLNERVDGFESKCSNVKNNKESEENSEENIDVHESIQNLSDRISSLETKTKNYLDSENQPRVHQIFVDLPNSKACNLLFRAPNQKKD